MADKVEYVLSIKDLASGSLKQVAMSSGSAEKGLNSLAGASNKAGIGLGSLVKGNLISNGIMAIGQAALGAVKGIFDMGKEMEMTRVSFEVMTGSAEKGNKLLSELRLMGAKTPFEFGDLAEAGKVLLNFGITEEKILPTLALLGDVAMGNKEKLHGLNLAFAQITATGRLMGQDLLQLVNNGFNPLQVISQKTGKSMKELKGLMEKGAISADMVTEAFKIATSEGGRFFQGMEKGSKTVEGRLSTVSDNIKAIALRLYEGSAGGISRVLAGIEQITQFVTSNLSKIGQVFAPLWDAFTPLVDGFREIMQMFGGVGTIGETMSKVFNKLGSIISWLSPLLKGIFWVMKQSMTALATMFGLVWKIIAKIAGPIARLLGYKDIDFKFKTDEKGQDFSVDRDKLNLDAFKDLDAIGAGKTKKSKSSAGGLAGSHAPKQIIINIHNLVNSLEIKAQNLTDSTQRIRDEIVKVLLEVPNDANIIASF